MSLGINVASFVFTVDALGNGFGYYQIREINSVVKKIKDFSFAVVNCLGEVLFVENNLENFIDHFSYQQARVSSDRLDSFAVFLIRGMRIGPEQTSVSLLG
jgi:hypothetical protein